MKIYRAFSVGTLLLSCLGLLFALSSFTPSAATTTDVEAFTQRLLDRVVDCISANDASPAKKERLLNLVGTLKEQHYYVERGSDDLRVKFVSVQGAIEHVLACAQAVGEIDSLMGIIHTPMPATPLCMLPDEDPSVGLLDPSIANDPDKLLTVRSRAQIVREYLHKGGVLFVAYPRGGLEKRTAEQQDIYFKALDQFHNLIDCVLDIDTLPEDRIGATYLFTDKKGNIYAFSIKSTQANDLRASHEWGIWFGPGTDPQVSERFDDIFRYLESVKGPFPQPLACDRCGDSICLACDRCGDLKMLACDRCGDALHLACDRCGDLVLTA